MDSNQSLANDSSNTSNIISPETNERKPSNNSNGDSGYHSDTSGYHKGEDLDASKTVDSSNEQLKTVEYTATNNSVTKISGGNGALLQDSEQQSDIDSSTVEATNCKALSYHNSYVTSHNGAYKSCSISTFDSSKNSLVTSTAINCVQHDCTLQESPHIYTTVASYVPVKTVNSYNPNDTFKATVQDLALKIEFCLMFGYTVTQIKAAITKLSYKASKNDILAELSTIQNVTARGVISSLEDAPTHYDVLGVGELISRGEPINKGDDDLISKGVDTSRGSDLQSRGPLSVDGKENNGERCIVDDSDNLRPIIIDGSNVAMSHGNKQYFSCKGILLAVDFFRNRNHRDITVFVPNYRKESPRSDAPIKDRQILNKLEEERILVYTPSRHINGKRVTCYDDRFILRLAEETEGVIVSNDHFRDLQNEKPEWKELIEKRLLMFSFVSDRFMPPDDPLGRSGPNINNFLRKKPANEEQSKRQCPYGKKCTYGKKCKFFHPECARPVSERMKEKSEKRLKATSESVEIAMELIKAGDELGLPLPATLRDKLNSQAPSLHSGSSQGQDCKSLSNGAWKVDNTRSRKVLNNGLEEGQAYAHSHGSGRPVTGPLSSDAPYSNNSQYSHNSANLPDALRHMSLSNQQYGMKSNSQMSALHSNGQVRYDAHYPLINDPSRLRFPANSYVQAENGQLDYHIDASHAKYKKAMMNQQYQHSSPSNLGVMDRNNSANPVMQRQHMNTNPHYPSVPGYQHQQSYPSPSHPMYQSGYPESPYPTNQHVYYNVSNHSHDNSGMRPGVLPSSSYYVAPINSSGSNSSSLSHSYPYVPLDKNVPPPSLSHHNLTNSSTGSEPKTYPPRAPRGYSSPNPHQHLPGSRYNSNSSFVQDVQPMTASHLSSSELPLSNVNNPRHYLYRNLCSLFQQRVVEAVMNAHPDIREPKVLVKMCLGSD